MMEQLIKVFKVDNFDFSSLRPAFSVQTELTKGPAGRVRSPNSYEKQPARSFGPPVTQPEINLEYFKYP
jgi:hypothetical protein